MTRLMFRRLPLDSFLKGLNINTFNLKGIKFYITIFQVNYGHKTIKLLKLFSILDN